MSERLWIGRKPTPAPRPPRPCGVRARGVALAQTQDDFFNDASLQEVRIVMSSRDWQTLKARAAENTYYPADLTWNGVTVRNIGIRSRGSATRNGIKPGLRVDINHYVTNQEFLGLKAFSLDNMYSDSSLVRETVTMKMFEKMKLPASREAHARVYVNNEYVGAYVVIEAIDRTFIERCSGRRRPMSNAAAICSSTSGCRRTTSNISGPISSSTRRCSSPRRGIPIRSRTSTRPLEEMIRTINESTDDDFAAAVGKYLDLGLFMKHLAVETFMVEWDGVVGFAGMNNFDLYRFRNGLSQFIPKDKDASLASLDDSVIFRFDSNVLVRRAMMVPALREAYLDALRQCVALAGEPAPDDPRGWLEREVERQVTLVTPAIADDPVFPYTFDEFLAHERVARRVCAASRAVCRLPGLANGRWARR